MEVGRSSVTGEGELWMEVEDTVIAQNMHEVILRYLYRSIFLIYAYVYVIY